MYPLFFFVHPQFSLFSTLELELLRDLPEEVGVHAAKVAERGSLLVEGSAELEVAGEHAGAEVKVLQDDVAELSVVLNASAVSVDVNREGLSNADRVRELDEAAVAELSSNKRLCDPAGRVGARAVDLRGVLSRESAAAVGTPAAVGVNDDFTTSDASITLGPANDKAARGVDVVNGAVVNHLLGENRGDDLLHDDLANGLVIDLRAVLSGDDDSVNADWNEVALVLLVLLVLDGHLRLCVRAEPGDGPVLAQCGHTLNELSGKNVSHRHELNGLVGGVAEHDALVAGADVLVDTAVAEDALGDVGALLFDGDEDRAGVVVEALGAVVVADLLDGLADDLVVVDDGGGGNLAENHHHTGLGGGLAGNAGVGILSKAGVENGVGHLVADLIGVTLRNRLGGEEDVAGRDHKLLVVRSRHFF